MFKQLPLQTNGHHQPHQHQQSNGGPVRGVIANFAFGNGRSVATSSSSMRIHQVSEPPKFVNSSNTLMSSQHRHLQQQQLQQQQQQQQQQFVQQHHQQQMTEKLNVQEIAAKFNQAINLNQNTVPRSQARLPSYALGQNFGKMGGSNMSLLTGSNVSLGPQENRLMQTNVLMSSQTSQVTV